MLNKEQLKNIVAALAEKFSSEASTLRFKSSGGDLGKLMETALEIQSEVLAACGLDPETGMQQIKEASKIYVSDPEVQKWIQDLKQQMNSIHSNSKT